MKRLSALVVAMVFGQAHAAFLQENQLFTYKLEMSRNDKVCRHMQTVYNKNFRQPWKTEPWGHGELEGKAYGEHSKYAFPRLPGVAHDDHFTFYMRYSRVPSSPEFDAINWREGRFTFGYGIPSVGEAYPFLVAEFDLNNDGHNDLVIKDSFGEDDRYQNRLVVLKSGAIDLLSPPTDWSVGDREAGEVTLFWAQTRPFILHGHTYLSIHDLWWIPRGTSHPTKKYMRVVDYVGKSSVRIGTDPGALDEIGDDVQSLKQICRFRMLPIKEAN